MLKEGENNETKKILKSSISVALALTITSVTAEAWPTSSYNIAKANYGDTQASDQTKSELRNLIDKIFNDKSITNRYLGTSFFHKTSNFPYYHVSFENHSVPDDVIDTTPWYNMWSEAATAKTKLEANSYTEKTAQNAINTLKYYINLYNFDVNHDLNKDGFYTTTDFKTPTVVRVDGDGEQDFYKKVTDNKEEIKELFKDNLIGIYKQGQDIEINLVANPEKITKITGFYVNKVSALDTNVKLGPTSENQKQVAFNVPGELKPEQLVITNMTYIDKNGNKQETGSFALDINYKSAILDNEEIPKYKEKLNEKIQNWIDRGNKVNEWLLTKENTEDNKPEINKPAVDKPSKPEVNKPAIDKPSEPANPIVEKPDKPEINKPTKPENNTTNNDISSLNIAKTQLLIPLEAAKIIIAGDELNENINKNALDKYKIIVDKAQKIYNSASSVEEVTAAIKELDTSLENYLKEKNTNPKASDETNPTVVPKDEKPSSEIANNPTTNTPSVSNQNSNNKLVENPTTTNNQNNSTNITTNNSTSIINNNNTINSEDINPNSKNIINKIFEDKNLGVKVTLLEETNASKLIAKVIDNSNLNKDILTKLNLPSDSKIRILDLSLVDKDNNLVDKKAKRTVAILLKENGELELIPSIISNNTVEFEIDHFSKFAIVSKTTDTKNTSTQDAPQHSINDKGEVKNTDKSSSDHSKKILSKTGIKNNNLQILGLTTLIMSGLCILNTRRKNRR